MKRNGWLILVFLALCGLLLVPGARSAGLRALPARPSFPVVAVGPALPAVLPSIPAPGPVLPGRPAVELPGVPPMPVLPAAFATVSFAAQAPVRTAEPVASQAPAAALAALPLTASKAEAPAPGRKRESKCPRPSRRLSLPEADLEAEIGILNSYFDGEKP